MKLTHLMTKVKCDSLNAVTAAITVALQGNPKYTYAMALKVYKAEVGKYRTSGKIRPNRQIREQNQGRGRGFGWSGKGFGRGRGRGGGRGYSGRGRDSGRGRGYPGRGELKLIHRTVDGSRFFNLSDGTRIEYHPSITYPPHIFNKFSREEREMLQNYRANGTVTPGNGYGRGRGYGGRGGGYSDNKQKIQQLEQEVWELRSKAYQQVPERVDTHPVTGNPNARSSVSQVTNNAGSIIGGRSDQAKQRRPAGRFWSSIDSVITVKRIISTVSNSNSHSEPEAGTMAANILRL